MESWKCRAGEEGSEKGEMSKVLQNQERHLWTVGWDTGFSKAHAIFV